MITESVGAFYTPDSSRSTTSWCCYTYYGHSLSDELADCLCAAAKGIVTV